MSKKPTVIDLYIGRRVRERRVVMELRQDELAERLGISFQQLQKYEIGENRISAARLFEIALALQADISWFFDGFAPQPIVGDSQELAVPARELPTSRAASQTGGENAISSTTLKAADAGWARRSQAERDG